MTRSNSLRAIDHKYTAESFVRKASFEVYDGARRAMYLALAEIAVECLAFRTR